MTQDRVRHAIASCVVGLTRHVMSRDSLSQDLAYRKVLGSELFKLVSDPDTRLCFEPNSDLAVYYDIETSKGIDSLYDAINQDPVS